MWVLIIIKDMPVIMEGQSLANKIIEVVRKDVSSLMERGYTTGLGLIMIGENPSSIQYLNAILKACKRCDIIPYEFRFKDNVSINEILNTINSINNDERIHGILIFFPIPRHLDSRKIVNSISPSKDVDGLGATSIGKFAAEESTFQLYNNYDLSITQQLGFLPCTPFGVIRLLEHYGIEIKGKHAVVVGKSLAVGKPLSLMLLTKEATVTICHKETGDLASFTRQADILCVAAGKSGLITGDMVKEGVIVVDIGINPLEDGRFTGDVIFDEVSKKASFITPVPGGVGPVTIAMLLENTVKSAKSRM